MAVTLRVPELHARGFITFQAHHWSLLEARRGDVVEDERINGALIIDPPMVAEAAQRRV